MFGIRCAQLRAGAPTGSSLQEPHRRVERRAAPHFQARTDCGVRRATASAHRQHVVGAHARGQERLVRVAERRVGDEQALLLEHPLGEFLRAEFEQQSAACPAGGVCLWSMAGDARGQERRP